MARCEGKVALVSGAASGIGAATARLLAAEGARVVLADIDADAAAAVAGGIGTAAAAVALDVRAQRSWDEAAAAAVAAFGAWNLLVNCAGILRRGTIESTSLEAWRETIDVNLTGTWRGCRAAVAHMGRHGGGNIVNLSSVSGMVGDADLAAYDASKGGVRLLTKSIALHCLEKRLAIRCNSVHPGVIWTPMVEDYIAASPDPEAERTIWRGYTPAAMAPGRAGDVARLIVFLASDESRFVNGAELVIDGGGTAE